MQNMSILEHFHRTSQEFQSSETAAMFLFSLSFVSLISLLNAGHVGD